VDFDASALDSGAIVSRSNAQSNLPSEFILYDPSPEIGEPIDMASPRTKAKWLRDRLRSVDRGHLQSLDQRFPGWRDHLRQDFERIQNPFERQLSRP
jgi:hypothetical protein